jgi:hypothetical protein
LNEYPQVIFTIRGIAEEFIDRTEFEIIAVNNYSSQSNRPQDKGAQNIEACAGNNPWLKAINYDKKKSHWAAKRAGVEASSGKFLLFVDAHTMPARDALKNAYSCYRTSYKALEGTLHVPLTYKILEWRRLIYGLRHDLEHGVVDYRFVSYRDNPVPYEVPCMSTCGMFITRKLYDEIGGWPEELGIYSGGEHFMNFTLAITGKRKFIMPGKPLYHHGDKRGYSWNYFDFVRNRAIATYMYGGAEMCRLMCRSARGRQPVLSSIAEEVIETCRPQRELIKSKQVMSIEDWLAEQDRKKAADEQGKT